MTVMPFATVSEWEDYLARNQADTNGIWLKLAKKASGIPSIAYDEAVEVALCYGWIDGLKHRFDDEYWLQRFTPRRPRSVWSKRNCETVERLINENRMQPSGLAEVEAAKADGRWGQAYASPRDMVVPDDFLAELARDKAAEAYFGTLNKANKFAIAWQLATAKMPKTRQRRMQKFLEMLGRGEKFS